MIKAISLLTLLLPVFAGKAPKAPKHDFETRIDMSIEKGVDFLRSRIKSNPWSSQKKDKYVMGRPAVEIYALLKSDVSLYDPLIQKSIKYLNTLPPRFTYGVSLYVMMLDAALSQIETDMALVSGRPGAKLRASGPLPNSFYKRLYEMHQWLLNTRRKGRGVWDYPSRNRNRYDHSCTQFGILGLGVTAKRGLKVPIELWNNVATHFMSTQQKKGPKVKLNLSFIKPEDGYQARTKVISKYGLEEKPPTVRARGWAYQEPKKGVKLTMTAAGLSSLILARSYLFRTREISPQRKIKINQSIWDGAAWLAKDGLNYKSWFYYGLYSVEKVGDLGGFEKIGNIDWYHQGAEIILSKQRKDGSWDAGDKHDQNRRYQTALALLFLNRATDLLVHAHPLILTGKGSGGGEKREGWIYVRRLSGEISARRFFRKLRFYPYSGMHRIARDIVEDSIGLGKAHELVPYFIKLSTSPYKNVVKLARESLEKITGEQYEDVKQYSKWLKTWTFVDNAARSYDKKAIPKLRKLFRETKSKILKEKLIWSFKKIRSLKPVEELLTELESKDSGERAQAYRAITFITGQRLPFDSNGPASTRREQILKWRDWFENKKKDLQ